MKQETIIKTILATGLGYGAFKFIDDKHNVVSDLKTIANYVPMLKKVRQYPNDHTVADEWEQTCDRQSAKDPMKPALIFAEDGKRWTFKQLDHAANRVARLFKEKLALKEGTVVAVMMENRPAFIITTLGLVKAGLIPAFINNNNKMKPLMHSLEVGQCEAIVFGEEVLENMATIYSQLKEKFPNMPLLMYNETKSVVFSDLANNDHEIANAIGALKAKALNVEKETSGLSPERLPRSVRSHQGKESTYGYIYTSGTTGLPKACIVKHSKLFIVPLMWQAVYKVTDSDILYTAMPLYHSAGGIISMGELYTNGCTIVLSRKFSASNFFKECAQYNCTMTQYIGEMARYLLSTPPSPYDRKHKIRLIVGNGLRREIWRPFLDRFGVTHVGEFYGSTESNIAFTHLVEDDGTEKAVGTVGRVGTIMKKSQKFKLVKHNVETEEPVRDANGFCIEVDVGEPGELLGYIDNRDPGKKFHGYTSEEATKKKLLHDVCVKGDCYFRTGDLLKQDKKGYLYFVDRIGDTFRWKGENVSTNEVSEVVSVFEGILEANVYGIKVPGNEDGRACMAAIVLKEVDESPTEADVETVKKALVNFDVRNFTQHINKNLATYARPMFLRFLPKMASTGTFKQQKVELVKDGIDISAIQDPVLYYNQKENTYEPLTKENYARIANGQAKL